MDPVVEHLGWLRLLNRRPRTVERRREALLRLALWAAPRPLLGLSAAELGGWQRWRATTVQPQTLRVETGQVREFYRWAWREGLIDADPTVRLVTPAGRRGLPRPIPDEAVANLRSGGLL